MLAETRFGVTSHRASATPSCRVHVGTDDVHRLNATRRSDFPQRSIDMRLNWKAPAILGILCCLGTSEAAAQWGAFGRGPFGPRHYRGGYGRVYAPPVVVTPYPYVVNQTRYVYTPPTVVTREIYQPAPLIERSIVQPPP